MTFPPSWNINPGLLRAPDGTFSTIDVPGALNSNAFGINSWCEIVGVYKDAAGAQHGFLLASPERGSVPRCAK